MSIDQIIDVHVRSRMSRYHRIGGAIQMLGVIQAVANAHPDVLVRGVVLEQFAPWLRLGCPNVVTVESGAPLCNELWPNAIDERDVDRLAAEFGWDRQQVWAEELGLTPAPATPIIGADAMQWARTTHTQLAGGKKVVWLSPYCNRPAWCWPAERWVELGSALQTAGYTVVATHLSTEPAFQFAGTTMPDVPPERTAALFSLADLIISHDAGLAHLAGFLGVPTIALCGPTLGPVVFGCYPSVRTIQAPGECCGCVSAAQQICAGGCGMLRNLATDTVLALASQVCG